MTTTTKQAVAVTESRDFKTAKREGGWLRRLVRWSTAWAWQTEIGTCAGLAVIKGIDMDEHKMDIKIQHDPALAQWIAKCFASMVANSPNYTEMQFDLAGKYRDKYEWMTVHIQKGNGKTPHQLRLEAERERDELRRKFNPPNEKALPRRGDAGGAQQQESK